MTCQLPYRQLNGYALGDASSFTNGANKTASIINLITDKIGSGSGAQTDTGKAAAVAVQIGGTITTIAPAFGPYAPVVAAVGVVIEASAKFVNAVFGTSKSKALLEQAGQYDQANSQIRIQIDQAANQNKVTANALNSLALKLKETGFGGLGELDGLWEDIFDQGSIQRAQYGLESAKSENKLLKTTLDQQISTLQTYIGKFNNLLNAISIEGQNKTFIKKVILWGLVGFTTAGLSYIGYKKFKGKKL